MQFEAHVGVGVVRSVILASLQALSLRRRKALGRDKTRICAEAVLLGDGV